MFMRSAALAAGLLAGLLPATFAQAAPTVSIELAQDGISPLIISSDSGVVTYGGTPLSKYGTFSFNSLTGTGQPLLPASSGIDLLSVNMSSVSSSALTLFITETGLTSTSLSKMFAGNIGGTIQNISGVEYSLYADTSNTAFGTGMQLGSSKTFIGLGSFGGSVGGEATGLSGLFSLTEKIVVTAAAKIDPMNPALVSFNAQATPSVPLPASAPMFGAALVVLGAVGYRLKHKKAAPTA